MNPKWGEVNRLRHGGKSFGVGGAPDVLRAIYGEDDFKGRLNAVAGDGFMMMMEWGGDGTISALAGHQYGSNPGDARARHHSDQMVNFVDQELRPVHWDEAMLDKVKTRDYRP